MLSDSISSNVSFFQETIDAFLQASEKELRNVVTDNRLSLMVTAIFVACNKDFWTKIENNIKIGGDAQQVLGEIFNLHLDSIWS